MPIFEYQCKDCGFVNEVLTSSGDGKAPACPKCGSRKTAKRISSFSAVVKQAKPASANKCCSCPSAGACPNAAME